MVSKAREDFPEPERPVTTVRVLRGMETLTLRRLCWRAPRTVMWVRRGVAGAGKVPASRPTGLDGIDAGSGFEMVLIGEFGHLTAKLLGYGMEGVETKWKSAAAWVEYPAAESACTR